MSSFLDKYDEAFITQLRANKNRERSIVRLSRARAWVFWLFIFTAILSLVNFILSCVGGKPDFAGCLSPFFGAGVFVLLDSQVKALKLVRRDEHLEGN